MLLLFTFALFRVKVKNSTKTIYYLFYLLLFLFSYILPSLTLVIEEDKDDLSEMVAELLL